MSIQIQVPETVILRPCITVFGIGGAGCNAVKNMIDASLSGVNFVVANTDAQTLEHSNADRKVQLGEKTTRGLGAGASPQVGREAAEESKDLIAEHLEGVNMVFVTAGMGGGTGTGAAPVIARLAREKGILTVGVVTKPFHFEGSHRMKMAEAGLAELQKYVDTLIVIPNQNLFRIANEKTTFADAFKMADCVLHDGVRGVTDLMIMPGLINLDFADVRTVMSEMGKAMMGTGEAEGDGRAIAAAENAISNPLLDHCSMKGAKGVLINITGGPDMTLFEVDEAANRIREEVDPDANIIFGSTFNPNASGTIRVSVVATGIDANLVVQNQYNTSHIMQNIVVPQKNAQVTEPEVEDKLNEITAENNLIKQEIEEDLSQIYNKVNSEEETKNEEGGENEDHALTSSNDLHETLAAISAARPSFIAPKPAEPRNAPHYPSGGQVFVDQKANLSRQETSQQPHQQLKPTMGIFGRMASSVGFRSTQPQEKAEVTVADATEENVLDIPAFLRRRKD